jgi:hypothetical protein
MLLARLMFDYPSPLVRGEKVPKADEGFVFPPQAPKQARVAHLLRSP